MTTVFTNEVRFNLAHHALGYVVIGVTLASFMTNGGQFSAINAIATIAVMLAGWVLKSTNDANAIERIGKNQRRGREELITDGWYSITRNPCYLGQALIIGGFLFLAPSLYNFGCFLLYFLVVNATVSVEEKRLEAQFGDEYAEYKRNVGRWLTLKRA